MSDEPEKLVLRYLRRLDERMEAVQGEIRDAKNRLGSLESQVSLLHTDIVHVHHRLDRMDDRLTRIEKRIDLIDA